MPRRSESYRNLEILPLTNVNGSKVGTGEYRNLTCCEDTSSLIVIVRGSRKRVFDSEVRTEDHLSVQKILTVLVKYGYKMEETLGLMQKLLPGPLEAGTSEPKDAVPPSPPGKAKHMLVDL